MSPQITRRFFLAGGISCIAGLSGCTALGTDEAVQASIDEAEAYQVEPNRLIARVVLSKPEGSEARVHLRWEVSNHEYTQATSSTVIVDEELASTSVALIMESPTDINLENVTRSEVQIGYGAPNTEWVSASFNKE